MPRKREVTKTAQTPSRKATKTVVVKNKVGAVVKEKKVFKGTSNKKVGEGSAVGGGGKSPTFKTVIKTKKDGTVKRKDIQTAGTWDTREKFSDGTETGRRYKVKREVTKRNGSL